METENIIDTKSNTLKIIDTAAKETDQIKDTIFQNVIEEEEEDEKQKSKNDNSKKAETLEEKDHENRKGNKLDNRINIDKIETPDPELNKANEMTKTNTINANVPSSSTSLSTQKNVNKKTAEDRIIEEHEKRIKLLLTMESYIKSILTLMQKDEASSPTASGTGCSNASTASINSNVSDKEPKAAEQENTAANIDKQSKTDKDEPMSANEDDHENNHTNTLLLALPTLQSYSAQGTTVSVTDNNDLKTSTEYTTTKTTPDADAIKPKNVESSSSVTVPSTSDAASGNQI